MQDPSSIEDLTGLTELHAATAAMCDDFAISDTDEEIGDRSEGENEWTTL